MISTIIVTGGTGFLGSHILPQLLDRYNRVVLLKRSTSNPWRIAPFLPRLTIYDVDTCPLAQVFVDNQIDAVVHLATMYIKHHTTVDEVVRMTESNVTFSAELLEQSVQHGVSVFINAGSCFEYRMKECPIFETDEIWPYNVYAATKVAFQKILEYYAHSRDLHVIDLKLFSPFGERDHDKLISTLIRSLMTDTPLALSDGEQQWNFTYAYDTAQAFVRALEAAPKLSTPYERINIGYDTAYSIRDVAMMLQTIAGKTLKVDWGAKPYPSDEIFYLNCDQTKARSILDWSPTYMLYSGLERTYNYYRTYGFGQTRES